MENERDYIAEQEQLAFALDSTYVNKTALVSEVKKYTRDQLQSFLQKQVLLILTDLFSVFFPRIKSSWLEQEHL